MRIWLVPALGASMVIAAIVASRVPQATAAVPAPAPPVVIAPHYAEPPPPPPPSPSRTGIPECDRYVAAVEQLERCAEFPAAARDSMQQGMDALVRNMRTLGEASRPNAVMACTQGVEAIQRAAASIRCAM